MTLSYRLRRRLSLVLLLVWLPLYIAAALYLVSLFERPSILVELGIYVGLGVIWALPFKAVFKGVGREAPDDGSADDGAPRG